MIAALASPLCGFRDFLGVSAADLLLDQLMTDLGGRDRPDPGVRDLAAAVGQVTGTVCDLLGVAPSRTPQLTFSVETGDDQGQPGPTATSSAGGDSAQVAFVYWLHARPRQFHGGPLRVYDAAIHDGHPTLDAGYRDCPVEHDTIVFFPACFWSELRPARRLDEVVPVNSPFADLYGVRFAIRGWIA
ncbi:hypothetical protein ACFYO1_13260 [Nocardia sp. NPDC006044]|uniref:hypothetical protein n=1 Tax=Nocardia sp. NPDC006044 TaxID=3364306 RepID=UPI0036977C81